MKNYSISDMNGTLFVIDADTGATISGPYKNEKSAKGRIRDLKAKETVETANIAACNAPATDFETDKPIIVIADHFTIASPNEAPVGLLTIDAANDKLIETLCVERGTFAIPDGCEAVRDSDGRATGEVVEKIGGGLPGDKAAILNAHPVPASAAKLAASSAYGKSKPFTINTDRRYGPIIRQVGCYPALSKRAYQR